MVAAAPPADWSAKYAAPVVDHGAAHGRGVELTIRHIALTGVFAFAAGIILASLSGFHEWMPFLLRGAWMTVKLTVLGCILAVLCAFVAAFGKMSRLRPVRWLAIAYIEVFRGTSALVQLFWLFFVLPHFGITLDPFTTGVLALGLNVGAYGAEVVRGAIQAVPRGQYEAATALNMSHWTMMRRIIVPQALLAMVPPWGNLFIELLKATALVSLITITDLTFAAYQINQTALRSVEIFSLVLVMYFFISQAIAWLMHSAERYLARGLARGRA
jgi:polar amino acid transport system permease protein